MPRKLSTDPKRIAWRAAWHRKSAANRQKSYWVGRLKREYGLSIEDYDALLRKQDFLCAACSCDLRQLPRKHVHVDHCHTTKKIRGILCGNCNKALGLLGDEIGRVQALVRYMSSTSLSTESRASGEALLEREFTTDGNPAATNNGEAR